MFPQDMPVSSLSYQASLSLACGALTDLVDYLFSAISRVVASICIALRSQSQARSRHAAFICAGLLASLVCWALFGNGSLRMAPRANRLLRWDDRVMSKPKRRCAICAKWPPPMRVAMRAYHCHTAESVGV